MKFSWILFFVIAFLNSSFAAVLLQSGVPTADSTTDDVQSWTTGDRAARAVYSQPGVYIGENRAARSVWIGNTWVDPSKNPLAAVYGADHRTPPYVLDDRTARTLKFNPDIYSPLRAPPERDAPGVFHYVGDNRAARTTWIDPNKTPLIYLTNYGSDDRNARTLKFNPDIYSPLTAPPERDAPGLFLNVEDNRAARTTWIDPSKTPLTKYGSDDRTPRKSKLNHEVHPGRAAALVAPAPGINSDVSELRGARKSWLESADAVGDDTVLYISDDRKGRAAPPVPADAPVYHVDLDLAEHGANRVIWGRGLFHQRV